MEKLYSPKQAAELLGLKRLAIYRWINSGRVGVIRLPNNRLRIAESELGKVDKLAKMIKKREMICLLQQKLETEPNKKILNCLEQKLNVCDMSNNCDTCELLKLCYELWVKVIDKSDDI